ncbi:MAG: organomercurial lyase [Haloechinothrix sp.]
MSDMTVDKLWEAAVHRFPEFSPDEQRAGLALLGELARGEPVTPSRLATVLGVPAEEAEAYLRDSRMSRLVYTDDQGAALGFFGLSTVSTDHRFTVDDRTLWTWCAADTLFLPELLEVTASVESKDPQSGEPVSLTVSPTAVERAEPDGVWVSMNSPEVWETTSAARIIVTACHYIHFFTSPESGRRWIEDHPNTVIIPLDDAFTWGQRQNRRMFGDALARRAATDPVSP